jgi:cell shape-determining protein MreC
MREFLKGLELDQETIDTIMAEYGKNVTLFKEKLDEYKEQVSDYEGQIAELNGKLETDAKSLENLQSLTNENRDLKTQLQMSDSNVKKEFMKFVTSEISSRVNDKTDFATALSDYKKENPQYFGDTVVKKVQSSPGLNTGGSQPPTTNDIMNDILRGASKNNE